MRRTYAGILGLIAFITVVAQSIVDGGSVETTIQAAMLALTAFMIFGMVAGSIAARAIDDSVRMQVEAELDADAQRVAEEQRADQRSGSRPRSGS